MSKSLAERIMARSKVEGINYLTKSAFFNEKDMISLPIPIMNIAFSAHPQGGYSPGITLWAGPSKHFKTIFMLLSAAAYLRKYPDAYFFLYDTEFGAPLKYFDTCGVDKDRVIHVPIYSAEELRTELQNALSEVKRGDHAFFGIDSIGNVASNKEINDAESGKEAADFTRAKVLKSLFRIATPHFASKDIPMAVINHTYETIEMFSKQVMGGGKGPYYAADNIFFLGRQKETKGSGANKEHVGFNYTIKVEKSRYVLEGSKFDVTVNFDTGLHKYSGIFELAVEFGFLTQVAKGKYAAVNQEDGTFEEKGDSQSKWETNSEFMESVVQNPKFIQKCQETFGLGGQANLTSEVE